MRGRQIVRTTASLRRLAFNLSFTSLLRTGWRHRGSVIRAADLALRLPEKVRQGRTSDALTEARAIVALNRGLRSDTSVRLSSISEGTALLKGQPRGRSLERARSALLTLDDVSDVRTDGA